MANLFTDIVLIGIVVTIVLVVIFLIIMMLHTRRIKKKGKDFDFNEDKLKKYKNIMEVMDKENVKKENSQSGNTGGARGWGRAGHPSTQERDDSTRDTERSGIGEGVSVPPDKTASVDGGYVKKRNKRTRRSFKRI